MIDKPKFEILKTIINSGGKPQIINDLVMRYDISSRTFYNYINEINYYLKDNKIDGCISIEGDLLHSSIKSEFFPRLSSLMNAMSFNEYKLSNMERRICIVIILLANNGAVKEKYFEDILMVSRTSIINDIHFVKSFFQEHDISFKENNHQGLEIECEESLRRKVVIELLLGHLFCNPEDNFLPLNPVSSFINGYLKLDKSRIVSEKAIMHCEKEMDIELADKDYYYLIMIVSYVVSRLKMSNVLSKVPDNVAKDKSFAISDHILFNLKDIISYNYAEVEFISGAIKQNLSINDVDNYDYVDNSYLQLIVKDFLDTISFYIKTNLTDDDNLSNFLVAHIDNCQRRITNGEDFNNPFISQVISKYNEHFYIIKNNIYILENSLSVSFSDDEIGLILMHILAAIERKKHSMYVPRIVVACGSGAATSNFLAALLRTNFNVNIISVSSIHNTLSVIENDNVDLIISTVPFTNARVPVVVVEPYLKNEDKRKIQHALNSISMKGIHIDVKDLPAIDSTVNKIQDNALEFSNIINNDLINLNVDSRNWKEAIISSGELLLWEKCISVNYLQQMVHLVDKYGPYIVIAKGIAFAHASPSQGSLKNGISIIRLNHPVIFGKEDFDPVKIVVGCSIMDSPENVNLLLKIMKLIKDPYFYDVVDKAKTNDEVLSLFLKVGVNYENN